ncbi:helix-turn-helix domain-containing protein [Vibrio sp. D404a]|uniref:GlxA family transcriptional regulator n=1 Tax=unclassified Vibrio TaxID=2614977 RepID=UPI002553786A|nr:MULTISPECIES: helix-turn-helix domain-containing protein [unclassified Vibrio]MDK9736763.1 helix-turn-helix domain-containing protein [Vibrio sp. D404a]MDK9795819.1 helix-turn-helix domain-containing protein [Vibrio sp. D449a]
MLSSATAPIKVAVIAFEGISAFHLSVPCLVFQDVFIEQQPKFSVTLCSVSGTEFSSGSGFGISIEDGIERARDCDIIVVPSWPNSLPQVPDALLSELQLCHSQGKTIVGLCLGAFVLAEAGLLDGKRATTHWAFSHQFKERFPLVEFDEQPLFIDNETTITSAGTAAALDCCLHIVRKICGTEVATQLARIMVTAPYRSGGQQQYIPTPIQTKPTQAISFEGVIQDIEQNLTQSYQLDEVASLCAMSRRTFTRQFKSAYGCSFGEWLLQQRLKLSQRLLESTSHPIHQVAEQAGFGSESVFRKHFKSTFNLAPTQWRDKFAKK